jgi:hypothetical protein
MVRYGNGVQMFIGVVRTVDELRMDWRRAARQLGLFRCERESRSVMVQARRIKAWRVPGTPEFNVHARIVARLAEEFSQGEG